MSSQGPSHGGIAGALQVLVVGLAACACHPARAPAPVRWRVEDPESCRQTLLLPIAEREQLEPAAVGREVTVTFANDAGPADLKPVMQEIDGEVSALTDDVKGFSISVRGDDPANVCRAARAVSRLAGVTSISVEVVGPRNSGLLLQAVTIEATLAVFESTKLDPRFKVQGLGGWPSEDRVRFAVSVGGKDPFVGLGLCTQWENVPGVRSCSPTLSLDRVRH